MREDAIAFYLEKAKDVNYEYFMRRVFPTMMSYAPGGRNYDLTVPLVARVDAWYDQHVIMAQWCEQLGVRYDGYKGDFVNAASVAKHACRYSVAGDLRKVRRAWRRVLEIAGWDFPDDVWKRQDGRAVDSWQAEWTAFRTLCFLRYGDREFVLDVENCCD